MKINWPKINLIPTLGVLFLGACAQPNNTLSSSGVEVKFLVGSALEKFCNQAATQLDQPVSYTHLTLPTNHPV